MKRVFLVAILVAGSPFCGSTLSANEPDGLAAAVAIQDTFVRVIESAEKSVVSIARAKIRPAAPPILEAPRRPFPGRAEPGIEDTERFIPNEFGAGIVLDENGLILTNYHLVRGGPTVEPRPDYKAEQTLYVRLPDRRGFEARILAADPRSDLAVLKIPANDLKPIRLGNAASARKGQFVIALGNPYQIARDGSASATWGIIGNLTRLPLSEPGRDDRPTGDTIQNLGVLMQIDTRLDLGTSGGALLNLQGELIGITTALAAIVGYEKSAGFAVPVDDSTRRIIETLRQGKEVEYGFLGVQMDDDDLLSSNDELLPVAAKYHQHGAARIKSVVPNLPAERGGLKNNDLVVRVGEKPIYSRKDLMREIGLLAPGTVVPMRVWRPADRADLQLAVEVGKWPRDNEEAMITSARIREPWRGLIYDYPTSRFRFSSTLMTRPERNSGVIVLDVLADSPAAAELRPEDVITHVNGRPVRTPKDFLEAVQGQTGPVQLQVLPGAQPQAPSRSVEIKPR
jgi:serine protease Do